MSYFIVCKVSIKMNARSEFFELSAEGRQVQEVVAAIFHTLLFHRTLGKFDYKQEGSYSVGTIGFEDVPCDFIDFTYVRCASEELDRVLMREIQAFSETLRNADGSQSGQISLEFYQKKRHRWPFPPESIIWERWTLKINVVSLPNEHERQIYREKVGEMLGEKVIAIASAMNRGEFVPKMPNQSELDLIFDVSYSDVQPYLFKITYQTSSPTNSSVVSTAVRKLLKDTLG